MNPLTNGSAVLGETRTARTIADGFTSHNIVLPDGSETKPGGAPLAKWQRTQSALRLATRICPPTEEYTPRVVDLGCLEGGYAVEFARAGYDVLGIEARADSVARCNWVKEQLGLDNLTFAQDDVRNVPNYGTFDIVLCFGLLYHLDAPAAFLRMLGAHTKDLLLVHTHFAEDRVNPTYPLSEMTEHEGYRGRWYLEAPGGNWMSQQQMEQAAWASWYNPTSFWPTKPHLLQAIRDAGFDIVSEQYDALQDIANDTYVETESRSMFAGIRSFR